MINVLKNKNKILSLTASLFVFLAFATGAMAQEANTDQILERLIGPLGNLLNDFVFYKFQVGDLEIPWIVVWMFAPMLFLTIYFGFINFRAFGIAKDIARGKYWDPSAPGQVSQFQALSTALSGTVGLGNIAGVGIAIGLGGPGATFWMIIIGFCAMSLKFAECTLGVKYREIHEDGSISGGPMYYLKHGLANRGFVKLGIFLSMAYAIFGLPTIVQWATINQMYSQISATTGLFEGQAWIFGVILASLVAIVIIGGITSIAKVTEKLVPSMVVLYLSTAFFILISNFSAIPDAFVTIFTHAFNPQSVAGGIVGVLIIGMKRAVYSTEAGLGTSSMVHAAAKTREPISEGLMGLVEPFIDTVIVSTITALVVIVSGAWQYPELNDIQLTSKAFETQFFWFPWILSIAVFMFGFSTLISWGYYMEKIWTFLFKESRFSVNLFKGVYLILLIPGASLSPQQVFNIIDSLFFLLAMPNIIGIYIMAPEIKADLKSYLARIKSGEIKQTNHTVDILAE